MSTTTLGSNSPSFDVRNGPKKGDPIGSRVYNCGENGDDFEDVLATSPSDAGGFRERWSDRDGHSNLQVPRTSHYLAEMLSYINISNLIFGDWAIS